MFRPIHLTFGALFICLMAIGANITAWFPFLAVPIGGTSVPLSLQTFFAILAGFILGRRLGTISMIVYTLIGIVGVPVFAGLKSGPMTILLPTGGFILSFIIIAYVVGRLNEKNHENKTRTYIYIALIGLFINYAFGVTYMYFSMKLVLEVDITYHLAWTSMIPFIIKDFSLTIVAALFMKKVDQVLPQTALVRQ